MKKFIAVLLVVLMLSSSFAMMSFAATYTYEVTGSCTCEGNHTPDTSKKCTCCLFCDNLNIALVTNCAKQSIDSDVKYLCCSECTGFYGCDCGCGCCVNDADIDGDNSNMGDYITEQDKENFVDGFQAILKVVSDFFDDLWETIKNFLGIDEVLGNGDK